VPDDFWSGLQGMLAAAGMVLASVLPLAAVAAWGVRRGGGRLLPPWRPWGGPWGGFEVLLAVLVIYILIPTTVASALQACGFPSGPLADSLPQVAAVAGGPGAVEVVRQAELDRIIFGLRMGVLALPVQVCLVVAVSRVFYPSWWLSTRPSLAARIGTALLAWLVLTPLVLFLNSVVSIAFTLMHWPMEPHPLAGLSGQGSVVAVLLLAQACVAAPVIEELLFRGIILGWAVGRRKPVPVPDVPARARPWLLLLVALLLALRATSPGGDTAEPGEAAAARYGAPTFALLLTFGLVGVTRVFRRKRRTAAAVYSSAAVFAMLHASVWPSPIPLFLFGLGLGWLAVRTRSLLVPILVHGLFNAVSAVYVLRGPG
jgi:membrane protease YdiL (CAAX protease family)